MAYLRRDEHLPDSATVIVGGRMADPEKLGEDAEDLRVRLEARGEEGTYGVSVCSLPGMSAIEIAQAADGRLPQTKMRRTTAAELRQLGYEIVPSGEPPHATLVFSAPPTDEDWHNLDNAFEDAEDNPVAGRRSPHA